MRKTSKILVASFFAAIFFYQGNVWAYDEIFVTDGSTLQGKVRLTGKLPEPRLFHLVLFPNIDMCSEIETDENMNRVVKDFEISPDGGLQDVVISLEYVEAGKPFIKDPILIRSEQCKFNPGVNIVRQDKEYEYEDIFVDNRDPVIHNSQVYQSEQGKIILNIPIPADEVTKNRISFKKDYKIFQMICGMHEFMQTWGYRVQNPYYFVTDKDGNYKIGDIPPGKYVVNAWHNLMKIQSKTIQVTADSTIDLNFEFDGNEVVRPHYETIESGRIKKDAFKSRAAILSN